VTLFIVIAVVMAALSLLFLLPPLLRARSDRADVDRARANLGVLKDQLAELEADHARGVVADAQYAEIKAELERRVIEDVQQEAATPAAVAPRSRWPAVVIAALVPLASAGLYVKFGDPGTFDRALQSASADQQDAHTMSPDRCASGWKRTLAMPPAGSRSHARSTRCASSTRRPGPTSGWWRWYLKTPMCWPTTRTRWPCRRDGSSRASRAS
jgi:cytochrome c-type biogenesis protein CcmI